VRSAVSVVNNLIVRHSKKNANPALEKTQYRIRIFLCAIFWDSEPALPVSDNSF